MRFDFILESPLLIGVAYSLWGVFMGTYSESSMVSYNADYAGEATPAAQRDFQ